MLIVDAARKHLLAMSKAQQDRVWDRFSGIRGGIGLGTALVRAVTDVQGELAIEKVGRMKKVRQNG